VNKAAVSAIRVACKSKPATPTPTPAPKLSFVFTTLKTLDVTKKHAVNTFKPTTPFWIQMQWTIKNLHGKNHVKAVVQFQISVNGKWQNDKSFLPGVFT